MQNDETLEERLNKAEEAALIDQVVILHDNGHVECHLCRSMNAAPGLNPHQPDCLLHQTYESDMRLVPRP